MKNKILTLLLLSTISTLSFSAEIIALKSGGEDTESQFDLRPASHLFSTAEQEDFEIGMGIIQDRIFQKEEILRKLRDETRPFRERMTICDQDFNAHFGSMVTIVDPSQYADYIDLILSVYNKTYELAEGIKSASNDLERNTCKNKLYYYLSYKIIHFQHFIAELPHKVPEHSLEDTFFDMIREKLCVGATKDFDIVTQYLKLCIHSRTSGTTSIRIDNQKLYDTYNKPLGTLQEEKLAGHPAFHGYVQAQSPEAAALMNQINQDLSLLLNRISHVSDNLSEGIKGVPILGINSAENQHDEKKLKEDILKLYDYIGPYILEAIHGYGESTREARNVLQKAGVDLKSWLDRFNGGRAFKQLDARTKKYVRDYIKQKEAETIQEQRRVEAERQAIKAAEAEQKRLATARKKKEKGARKKEREKALKAEEKAASSLAVSSNAFEEETAAFNAMTLHSPDIKESTDSNIEIATQGATTGSAVASTLHAEWKIPPESVVRKEKVKTRKNSVEETKDTVEEEAKETRASAKSEAKVGSTLPKYFQDTTFQTLIENLYRERKERKLKSEFARLKTEHGITSENEEKKNKGYFMVVSPITQKRAVKTYHDLHDPENPFASIFMAMRQVLDESQLLMAIKS